MAQWWSVFHRSKFLVQRKAFQVTSKIPHTSPPIPAIVWRCVTRYRWEVCSDLSGWPRPVWLSLSRWGKGSRQGLERRSESEGSQRRSIRGVPAGESVWDSLMTGIQYSTVVLTHPYGNLRASFSTPWLMLRHPFWYHHAVPRTKAGIFSCYAKLSFLICQSNGSTLASKRKLHPRDSTPLKFRTLCWKVHLIQPFEAGISARG